MAADSRDATDAMVRRNEARPHAACDATTAGGVKCAVAAASR
jgi:hypothetical protein